MGKNFQIETVEFKDDFFYGEKNEETPEKILIDREEKKNYLTEERRKRIAKLIAYYVYSKVLSNHERRFWKFMLFESQCENSEEIAKKMGISASYARKLRERVIKRIKSEKKLMEECRIIHGLIPYVIKLYNPFDSEL